MLFRSVNAVAVGEIHPMDAPLPKRNLLLHKQNIYAIIYYILKRGFNDGTVNDLMGDV